MDPPPRRPATRSIGSRPKGSEIRLGGQVHPEEQGRGGVCRGRSASSAPADSTRRSAGSNSRWQLEPDWPNHGLNAYGLALAHHRLVHAGDARRWLDIAERWLVRLDRIYAVEAPRMLTGQPQMPVSFEFWVYAQVLRREAAGPILDTGLPSRPVRAMSPVGRRQDISLPPPNAIRTIAAGYEGC